MIENLPVQIKMLAAREDEFFPLDETRLLELFEKMKTHSVSADFFYAYREALTLDEGLALLYFSGMVQSSMNTIRAYIKGLALFSAHCGKPLNRATALDVNDFPRYLEKEHGLKSVNSIKLRLASIKSFYRKMAAAEPGIVKGNPTALTVIKDDAGEEANSILLKSISQEEVEACLNYLKSKAATIKTPGRRYRAFRNRVMVYFLFRMALRAEEWCTLKWSSIVNPQRSGVFLKILGKGNKTRIVKIPKPGVKLLMELRQEQFAILPSDPSPEAIQDLYIFSGAKPGHPMSRTTAFRIIKEVCTEAIDNAAVSPHWARYTAILDMYTRGVDLADLQIMAGHKSNKTTSTYVIAKRIQSSATAVYDDEKV